MDCKIEKDRNGRVYKITIGNLTAQKDGLYFRYFDESKKDEIYGGKCNGISLNEEEKKTFCEFYALAEETAKKLDAENYARKKALEGQEDENCGLWGEES
jgi:hypothetical protein